MFSSRLLSSLIGQMRLTKPKAFQNSSTKINSSKVSTFDDSEIILVTGGAGFLGSHVVHLLQTRAPYVGEIRVLDVKPYQHLCETHSKQAVVSTVGSITNLDVVAQACKGVNSVIHIAGLVSYGTFPDISQMENVNVNGTATVIKACLQENVHRLLFCSTVDVVIGFSDIIGGNEDTVHKPKKFLFPGYPETKCKAEALVLAVNGQPTECGEKLKTLALRANVLYGEGDPYYVTSALRRANYHGGTLLRVGNGTALFQQAYAGNTAWAFLCADKALKMDGSVGGRAYFVPDNTPVQNTFCFLSPYLACRGYGISRCYIPYRLAYGIMCVVEIMLKWLSPFKKINIESPACSIKYINMNLYFSMRRAQKCLGYEPIFSPEESEIKSLCYYTNLKL